MKRIFSDKLQSGDTVRIIAPSKSMGTVTKEQQEIVMRRFDELGLIVTFGEHASEMNEFGSSSIESRISDLHNAFRDKKVKAIFAAAGGFNANQLLDHIDWDLIKENPKIFCGYSDITTLTSAIFAKTGLITYSGPVFVSFCDKQQIEFTLAYVRKCLMQEESYMVKSSSRWSNNRWLENTPFHFNKGFWMIQEGKGEGTIVGDNLRTFDLLKGTEYFPHLHESILFLEDDKENLPHHIDENLQALILDEKFLHIRGIVIGRFQTQSKMNRRVLKKIIANKKELRHLPIVANVDFGHTEPKITFPIGGTVRLHVTAYSAQIEITEH